MSEEELIVYNRYYPMELTEKELWHLTDHELLVLRRKQKLEKARKRANVKLVKDFSRKGKQLNIKF